MIILVIFICIIMTYIAFIYFSNILLKSIFTLFFGLLTFIGTALIIMNSNNHYLMVTKSTHHVQRIYPTTVNNGKRIMTYQPIGTDGKHRVVTYRPANNSNKITQTSVDKFTVNKVRYTKSKNASLKITTKQWHYTKMGNFWFGVTNWKFGNNNQFKTIKVVNQFSIPKQWQLVSNSKIKN